MLSILLAAVVVILDRLVKNRILASIPLGGSVSFLPGIIGLTYIRNTGAAFSMFKEHPEFLTILTSALAIVLLVMIFASKLSKWEKLCLGAVLGGAVGNIIDRIMYGYVVDMFAVEFMHFAVFNLGDCFIVVGGIVFCILYFIDTVKEEKAKKQSEN